MIGMKKIEHDVRVAAEIGYDVRWSHPFVKAIADRFDEIRAHRRAMAEAADRKIGKLTTELAEARSLNESLRGEVRRLRPIEVRAREVAGNASGLPLEVCRHILGEAGDG